MLLFLTAAVTLVSLVACSSLPSPSFGRSDSADTVELTEMRRFVEREITDPGRSQTLLLLIQRAETQIDTLNELHTAAVAERRAIEKDYRVSEAQIVEVRESQADRRRPARKALVHTFVAIKLHTTPEEWATLAPIKSREVLGRLAGSDHLTQQG